MATGLAAALTAPAATGSAGRTTVVLRAALAAMTKAGDVILPLVIWADTGVALMPAAAGGLAAVAALVTMVTAMDNQGLGDSGALLRCVIDLGELKARAGIDEGWEGTSLEYLGMKLVCRAQPIDELQSQVEGAFNGCQIIRDALQLAGIGGD
jgi:hypothetical protein